MPAGRPNPLADPKFAAQVAEMDAAGASRRQMADVFGVKDLDTITRWCKDERVKKLSHKIRQDQVHRIVRIVDAQILSTLLADEKLTIKEKLEIRKEFLGGESRRATQAADEDTINAGVDFAEAHPDLMDQLREAAEGTVEELLTDD